MFLNRVMLLMLVIVIIAFSIVSAQEEPSIHGTKKADVVFQERGLAIKGYDPVSYFDQKKPVRGKKEFEYNFMGANWRFASAENRDAFAKDPDKFLPQYGGYCAFGMSHGYAAPTDPAAWSVVDGKLYLNYNRDIRREWNKNIQGHIANADTNWPKIPKKEIEKEKNENQ